MDIQLINWIEIKFNKYKKLESSLSSKCKNVSKFYLLICHNIMSDY